MAVKKATKKKAAKKKATRKTAARKRKVGDDEYIEKVQNETTSREELELVKKK